MSKLLEVESLKKYFSVTKGILLTKKVGWIKAVDGVSFSIEQGTTFALVGESGCGKTTTARVVLRLEKESADPISCGREIGQLRGKGLRQIRSSVQAVFQDPSASLNPRMRVGATVAEPLEVNRRLSRKEIQGKVEEVLVRVGLNPEVARLFPHEFSGGQRQRIAVARSLILNPRLIVLDEPVSALDVSIQAQIMNLLKDLQVQLGITYLLIAHNLATVRYMAQHIGVMYLGKLVERGPMEQVYVNRLHPYTKALFSAALPLHPDQATGMIELPGEVPSAMNPPSGCHFHPRCSIAMPICSEVQPELKEVGPDHYGACHLL